MARWTLRIHLAATLYLVGVIWFVQVVHYPLLTEVGEAGFAAYQKANIRLATWAVAPAMIAEGLAAAALLRWRPAGIPAAWVWMGLLLLCVIWISTFSLQFPSHQILAKGFEASVHRSLILTNWIRTVAWSARGILSLAMIPRAQAS
ncbi:MAG: hypothetical protein O7H41_03950 [Planctomycetota bacterium]|nr:hypothetical protein [Planctomycetota bacterium]